MPNTNSASRLYQILYDATAQAGQLQTQPVLVKVLQLSAENQTGLTRELAHSLDLIYGEIGC